MELLLMVVLCLVQPLILTNKYSNVTVTKYVVISLWAITLFLYVAFKRYREWLQATDGKVGFGGLMQTLMGELYVSDYCMLGYLVMNLISWLASEDIAYSFVAAEDKHMGFYWVIITALLYTGVRLVRKPKLQVLGFLLAVGLSAVVLFALTQFLGGDPFSLCANLYEEQRHNFVSTLGNTGLYGRYVTAIGAVIAWFYIDYDWKLWQRIVLGISLVLVPCGLMSSNTDATMLGMIIVYFGLLVASLCAGRGRYYLETLVLSCAGVLVFTALYRNLKKILTVYPMFRFGRLIMQYWPVMLGVMIILILLRVLVAVFRHRRTGESTDESSANTKGRRIESRIAHILVHLASLACVLILAAMIYFSAINTTADLGTLGDYLRFTKSWGTERGYVWTWVTEIFLGGNLKQQLIGFGQGMVPVTLSDQYLSTMLSELGYIFDNAHNVYLHQLINIGVIGVTVYLGFLIMSLRRLFCDEKKYGFAVALLALMIMDLVSIAEPVTWPLLFILSGISWEKTEA